MEQLQARRRWDRVLPPTPVRPTGRQTQRRPETLGRPVDELGHRRVEIPSWFLRRQRGLDEIRHQGAVPGQPTVEVGGLHGRCVSDVDVRVRHFRRDRGDSPRLREWFDHRLLDLAQAARKIDHVDGCLDLLENLVERLNRGQQGLDLVEHGVDRLPACGQDVARGNCPKAARGGNAPRRTHAGEPTTDVPRAARRQCREG